MKRPKKEVTPTGPSTALFVQLCTELDRVEDAALSSHLPPLLAKLDAWPDDVRSIWVSRNEFNDRQTQVAEQGPAAGWAWDLFLGVFNPRLAVLRRAWLSDEVKFPRSPTPPHPKERWGKQTPESLTLAFARHLQPSFSYPPVLLGTEKKETPGFEDQIERFGDDKTGLVHTDYTIEHAGDYTFGDRYQPYGLPKGSAVELDLFVRSKSWTYKLALGGPAPAVLEAALTWGEIVRRGPALLDVERFFGR